MAGDRRSRDGRGRRRCGDVGRPALAARARGCPNVEPSTIHAEVRRHGRLAQILRARVDPQATTGLALTVAGAIVIVGGVGVGLLLLMVRRNLGFAEWDLSAAGAAGAQHATHASTAVLRDISQLGGTLGLIVVVLLTLVVEQRRMPNRAAIGFLLLVVVGQNLLANGTKALVNRARPDLSQLTGFAGSSFPSGHSTAAAATYAAIALLLSRRRSPAIRSLLAGGAVRHRGRRGRQPGAARRPLAHRRDGRAGPRVGLVRSVLHRLRWPPDALRRPCRGGQQAAVAQAEDGAGTVPSAAAGP